MDAVVKAAARHPVWTSSRSRPTSRRSSSSCTGRPTTPTEILRRGLLDRRRALVAWSLGVAAYVLLIAAIFPSIESSKELDNLMKSYPEPLKELFGIGAGSITSGPGYLDAELFSFMLPLFVLVLAIGSGARAFAGEEDAGGSSSSFPIPSAAAAPSSRKGLRSPSKWWSSALSSLPGWRCSIPSSASSWPPGRPYRRLSASQCWEFCTGGSRSPSGTAVPSRALALGVPAALAAAGYLVGGLHELAVGSIPSACSPRSGGSAGDRSRTVRGDGACSSSPLPRSRCLRPPRCSSSGAT